MVGIMLDLFAQAADMNIHGAVTLDVGAVPPHSIEYLLAGNGLAPVLREETQQAKFGWREVQQFAAAPRLAAGPVQDQIGGIEYVTAADSR